MNNISLVVVCISLFFTACLQWKRNKIQSEVDRLNLDLQKYNKTSGSEKAALAGAVSDLQQKVEQLKESKDESDEKNKALKEEVEKLKADLEMKKFAFGLEESVSSAEVEIINFDGMDVEKKMNFQRFVEDIESKVDQFRSNYPEQVEVSERYVSRVSILKQKITGYKKLGDVRGRLEKYWLEVDGHTQASKIDVNAMNEETKSMATIIREIYEVLPYEIEKLNQLLKEVAELKSVVAYQTIKAEYHTCKSQQSKIEAAVEKKLAACNEEDAKYSKCLAEVADKKAKKTMGGMASGAVLGLLLAPFTGGASLLVAGGALAGGAVGYVSESKSSCGELPKCVKVAVELEKQVLAEEGLLQYPYCGIEPKKEDFVQSAFIPLLVELPSDASGKVSEQAAAVKKMHDEFSDGLKHSEAEISEIKDGIKYFIAKYEEANTQYTDAEKMWKEAQEKYKATSKEYNEAKAKYDDAASTLNKVSTTLIVLAASATVSELVCATKEPAQAFRKKLESSGQNLEGKDVDHIIPKSEGGADHPLNYQEWDSSKNRSCGAGCLPDKFISNPPAFMIALAVSAIVALNCGG